MVKLPPAIQRIPCGALSFVGKGVASADEAKLIHNAQRQMRMQKKERL
jgi:hypothetical protein